MNIIYETTKERGATILMPTSMVDSMNPVVALALAGHDNFAPGMQLDRCRRANAPRGRKALPASKRLHLLANQHDAVWKGLLVNVP
jgi:hypothetical protein